LATVILTIIHRYTFSTSTLDWCEENYHVSGVVAEFWNTITNIVFILLSFYAVRNYLRHDSQKRFLLVYAGMGLVGVGSWLFHMTLVFEMQLLDELPMLYGTCVILHNVIEIERTSKLGPTFPVFLVLESIVLTVLYVYNKNPLFHQITFGVQMLLALGCAIYHTTHLPKHHKATPTLIKLVVGGTVMFVSGFVLWNMDNQYCGWLRHLRQEWGYPWSPLLQLHGWWHILTGLGIYWGLTFTEYLRMAKVGRVGFDVVWYYGLVPTIKRVEDKLE
jgi:dihydroceramidase